MVKSSDRTFALIALMAGKGPGFTHAQLAQALGMPKSSLTQMLHGAVQAGFVVFDGPARLYSAGPALRRLAGQLASAARQPAADARTLQIEAAVRHVAQTTGEAASYCVFDGFEVLRSVVAQSRHMLAYRMEPGARFALHTTSTGKLLLATWAPAERAAYWRHQRTAGRAKVGTRSATRSDAALAAQLQQARSSGVAYSIEEQTPGVVAVAVPVPFEGRLVGALNVAMPRLRFTPAFEALCIDALQEGVRLIEA
ncbi:MAG: hypothetical protein EOO29_36205 [Comamonadaceae bacterium]|nr:MAG: hypothetical protein EOO29_36205 [Comamonadaceae bacterium]